MGKEVSKRNELKLIFVAVFVLFISYGLFIFLGTNGVNSPFDLGRVGSFGDSFGVLTSVFSGFAFLGLLTTLFMQQEQLKMQSEELSLTREELAKSANSQAEQTREMKYSAELNAVSTLATIYSDRVASATQKGTPYLADMTLANEHIQRLERLVKHNETNREIDDLLDKVVDSETYDEQAEQIVKDILSKKK